MLSQKKEKKAKKKKKKEKKSKKRKRRRGDEEDEEAFLEEESGLGVSEGEDKHCLGLQTEDDEDGKGDEMEEEGRLQSAVSGDEDDGNLTDKTTERSEDGEHRHRQLGDEESKRSRLEKEIRKRERREKRMRKMAKKAKKERRRREISESEKDVTEYETTDFETDLLSARRSVSGLLLQRHMKVALVLVFHCNTVRNHHRF